MQPMMRFLALVMLCRVAAAAQADIVTIGASRDNTIFAADNTVSDGAGLGMYAGTDNSGVAGDHRALVGFDVAGNVPAGAVIQSAELTLTLGLVAGSTRTGGDTTPRTISLFRLAADWGEGTAGVDSMQIAGTGGGFAAGEGDATWNARAYSTTTPTLWSAPGGDFSVAASGALSVDNPGNASTPFTWSSTAAMVGDVQSWLDDPVHNFGWILVNSDENAFRTFRAFYTREISDPQFRPALQISYVLVPEPAAFTLLMFGAWGLGVVAWNRKRSGKQGG